MKNLIIIIVALGLAAWIGLGLHHDPGMLIVTVAGWRIDAPLWLGVVGLIFFSFLLHYLLRLCVGILSAGTWLKKFSLGYRRQRAKKLTNKGLVALAEGKWALAQSALLQGAPHSEMPWVNYLAAARAAQELGEDQKRDECLRQAKETDPENELAIGLMQAKLQYQRGQYDQSLATLTYLRNKTPHQQYVLKLLHEIYVRLKEWGSLQELLPQLKHYHILNAQAFQSLEKQVYVELLSEGKKSLEHIEAVWQKIPKALRLDAEIAISYAKGLLKYHKPIPAEHVLRGALKHEWREEIIRLYGQLNHPQPQKLLSTAESWVTLHPESPGLMLTLGRLCAQQQLWGKAQRYFEASLGLVTHPETYAELGTLLEKMNKPELGAQYFKKGLLQAALYPS